ncbi:nitronate monooxygenase [Psychroserpens sp. AS72]|uniref:NAD(P)H-dependent flavin oxidoreductase n=1 Tax=Psychroserpens sp. AS72 TaxID=3135775 RepID=UPI00316C91C3
MKELLEMLNIDYPIIQAPIGGVVTTELVAAVSNCGALGGLALSWSSPEDAEIKIKQLKSLTSKPFYANFVLNFEPKALKRTLELDVKIIQFSWGMPSIELVDLIKSFNAKIGIQVTDKESALRAMSLGADYLVCQGTQAGGHVQASKTLEKALPEVLQAANGKMPVLASGGISCGNDIKKFLVLGASGVVMGSRFVASIESGAHQIYKENLVNSNSDDTVLTVCMNKGWDNASHRIIRNTTFKMWESDGCAKIGNRPGEFDILGKNVSGKNIERYSFSAPVSGVSGNIEAMTLYAGTSVNNINNIKSASDIVKDIWDEYLNK